MISVHKENSRRNVVSAREGIDTDVTTHCGNEATTSRNGALARKGITEH